MCQDQAGQCQAGKVPSPTMHQWSCVAARAWAPEVLRSDALLPVQLVQLQLVDSNTTKNQQRRAVPTLEGPKLTP